MPDVMPTRSVAIELSGERRLIRQGYTFLDEKRMLLAAEILRQLKFYQERENRLVSDMRAASALLSGAVERHGFDALQVYPHPAAPSLPGTEQSFFLGLPMLALGTPTDDSPPDPKVIDPSPEAKACRMAFAALLWGAADLGIRAGNLSRLAQEYRRSERRARALEKVLLPEVEKALRYVDEQLESVELEDVARTARLNRLKTSEL